MKGHQIFWLGCFIFIWLGWLTHYINDYSSYTCGYCIVFVIITAIILFVDIMLTLANVNDEYKGIWWLIYQPIKCINSLLDRILK